MATFKIHLYTQRKLNKNLYNLTIRVCVKRDVQYLNIAKITQSQFNNVFKKNSMDDDSIEFRNKCQGYINKCERIFADMRLYDKKRFRELFYDKDREIPKTLNVKNLFQYYVESKPDLKWRTKVHYKMTGSIFDTYKKDLVIDDITPDFLRKFEKAKLAKGCSQATVDTYNRNLRSVINYFTHEVKLIPKHYQYPFGKGGYSISTFWPKKQVLTNEEIKMIVDCTDFISKDEEYARDVWLFLYRCNGINFADLLRLRWDHQKGKNFVFFRKKTETTRKNNKKELTPPITPKLQEVIDKIGVKESPFVLGVLQDGYTESYFENKSHKMRQELNRTLSELSKRLNLSVILKIKSARDCYASTLKRAGISIDVIGENMGHAYLEMTAHYVDSMSLEDTHKVNEVLF